MYLYNILSDSLLNSTLRKVDFSALQILNAVIIIGLKQNHFKREGSLSIHFLGQRFFFAGFLEVIILRLIPGFHW